jgi:hypothetical protein
MAVVKKKKIKEEKKPVEVVEVVEQEVKVPEELHRDHLLALETMGRDIENARIMVLMEEQNYANMQLRLKILSDTIEKQNILVNEKVQKYENTKTKYTQFKKDIWHQYGFKENESMGYDPLTGKIVRN